MEVRRRFEEREAGGVKISEVTLDIKGRDERGGVWGEG